MVRVIMLVDLDYFFAQVEETRNPSIRDRPVVVCVYSGRSEDSGVASTANYVARKFGVRSGMPIFLAKKKLANTDAVFLPVDHSFYEEVSERVMAILRGSADCFEQAGVDEAYLDVSNSTRGDFHEAARLAQAIKNELTSRLSLTCSIGVGPNKLTAKIAADSQKPDGLTVIEPEQISVFLSPLPVSRLLGVGVKTKERMLSLGINTIGDLAGYDVQKLVGVFGKALGTYFHNAALGLDNTPVQETGETESISKITTLKKDTRDLDIVLEKANQLCNEIHATIVQQKLTFKTIGVSAVLVDMSIHSRSKTYDNPTDSLDAMKKAAGELFEKLLAKTELEARRVGVKVSNLTQEQKSQKQITSFLESSSN